MASTMGADALAYCGTRSSATMILIIQDKQVLFDRGKGCLCHLTQCVEMIENTHIFPYIYIYIQHKGLIQAPCAICHTKVLE